MLRPDSNSSGIQRNHDKSSPNGVGKRTSLPPAGEPLYAASRGRGGPTDPLIQPRSPRPPFGLFPPHRPGAEPGSRPPGVPSRIQNGRRSGGGRRPGPNILPRKGGFLRFLSSDSPCDRFPIGLGSTSQARDFPTPIRRGRPSSCRRRHHPNLLTADLTTEPDSMLAINSCALPGPMRSSLRLIVRPVHP